MKTQSQEEFISSLPEGFIVRGATLEDVEPALELYNRWAQSVVHENEFTDTEAVRNEWVSPGFDPADNIHLVFAPDGEMVGYIEVWTDAKPPIHPWIWGRVDPRYGGLGIGTYLLTWAETRAKKALNEVPAEFRFAPRVGTFQQAEGSKRLFEDMGYQRIRTSYNMRINMDAPPPAPIWPEGINLKIYDPETDLEAVYRADVEAFRDHFGYVEAPFEQGLERFKHFMTGYEGFDPSLWFLAMDGDEITGFCLCRKEAYYNPEVVQP